MLKLLRFKIYNLLKYPKIYSNLIIFEKKQVNTESCNTIIKSNNILLFYRFLFWGYLFHNKFSFISPKLKWTSNKC